MNRVPALTKYTCGLACLESYFRDVGDKTDQCKMLKDFTDVLLNPDKDWEYGTTSPEQIEKISHQLKYKAVTYEVYDQLKVEEIFAYSNKNKFAVIVFCHWEGKTQHFVRFSKILSPGLYEVMYPGFPNAARREKVKFTELTEWGNNFPKLPKFLLILVDKNQSD
jgi:hypothetical protein